MLMQQQYAPQESAYQASRAEALHNVETTIVELGSIFTQLAEMVAAQVKPGYVRGGEGGGARVCDTRSCFEYAILFSNAGTWGGRGVTRAGRRRVA